MFSLRQIFSITELSRMLKVTLYFATPRVVGGVLSHTPAPLGFFTFAMYSRCTPDVTFKWSGDIAKYHEHVPRCIAEASAMIRRWIGDVMRRRETSRELRKNSMHALKFFAMHSRCFLWINNRRCIGDLSSIYCLFRSIPEASPMHRRSIRDASGMHIR